MPVIDRRCGALLVGLVLLGASAGCDRGTKAKAASSPPLPDVVVAQVEQRPVSIVRDFTARTEAVPTVEVRARISGVLEQVLFKEGTEVKRGQTLFIVQQEEYKAALETARAQLAKAQADLTRARDISVIERARAQLAQRQADLERARADVARYRPLVEARAIPQQDLDTSLSAEKVAAAAVDAAAAALKDAELAQRTQIQLAEAAVESGKAAVIQAELNLRYTTIRSPITGIVGKVMVDRGNLVGKAEPTVLTTVSSVNPIYVDFSVAEADYLRLAPRVRLDPEGRPQDERTPLDLFLADDRPLSQKGHIVFVDRAVDARTGTITVRAEFPNPDRVIRPGQFARVRGVVEQRPDAVLVPQIAVQEQQGSKVVLVVEPGDKVAMRLVAVEERIGDFYLVKSGLEPAERVIVEGMQKVRPGMQVKAVARGSESPSQSPSAQPTQQPAEKSAGKPGA
jgi:membrane fusion protein (multidrug efflux system)